MKSFIVFAMLVAAAMAAPASLESEAVVLKNYNDNIGIDKFSHASETSNGISQQADGVLKNIGTENEALEIRGSYSYPGPDGVLYTVLYIANELGFQPQGDHLPKAQ